MTRLQTPPETVAFFCAAMTRGCCAYAFDAADQIVDAIDASLLIHACGRPRCDVETASLMKRCLAVIATLLVSVGVAVRLMQAILKASCAAYLSSDS
ncbi:hypothetical protein LLE67_15230 [Xanthomonas campestris]|uniref:hypothetical protein n=1 Tax=Xanthomonas campestris TaxID=339 RepID=UPI001E653317|nr:hypothetical protein [Xanthomonas campestris]MCC5069177.1 hypothetical protein [Xanthomonas campestris]